MTARHVDSGSWTPTVAETARAGMLVDDFVEQERIIARARARQATALMGLAEIAQAQTARSGSSSSFEFASRSMAAELGAAARIPDGTIRARMADAITLVSEFPATFAALEEGRISEAHARVIVAAGERIEDDDARVEYEAIILQRAHTETSGRLRALARALADRVEPLPLSERHAEAMESRGVRVDPLEDGMAALLLTGPAPVIYGIHDRVTQMATAIRRASDADDRTLDQIRADVLADLLLTGTPTDGEGIDAIRATVQVTIPATTLTGDDTESAFLTGYGPIDPATARRLAGGAPGWARLFLDPDTGCLRSTDAYTPTAAQRRFLTARDEHCRFPGCRQPARRSDIDHTIPYSERGPTDVANLSHLCESHHMLRHHSPWQKRQRSDGTVEWVSPLGRTYANVPTPVVHFRALDEVAMPDLGLSPAPF